MRKIVLTGGPYAGKSTLAEELRASGFAVAPEAALLVIEALGRELGAERARAWREHHPDRFQLRIAELQIELEARAQRSGAEWIVCDRGLPDGIAYCRLRGIEPPPDLVELAAGARYDAVLLLETLASFDPRPASGRIDARGDALRLHGLLHAVYVEHRHEPVEIPERSLVERVSLVQDALEHVRGPGDS